MTYQEVLEQAKDCIGKYCRACPVCNGRACRNQIPGPGAKGVGDTAIRNYDKWQEIRVNMDTLCENEPVDFPCSGNSSAIPSSRGRWARSIFITGTNTVMKPTMIFWFLPARRRELPLLRGTGQTRRW